MRNPTALLTASLLFVACDLDSPTWPVNVPLSLQTVVQAYVSGFTEPRREMIHSSDEWSGVWQTLHAGLSPVPELPAIDFGREMLVLAATGTRSSGCFQIDVTAATLTRHGKIEIQVVETYPGPACACIAVLTQPVHVVRVERVPGPESFVESRRELRC